MYSRGQRAALIDLEADAFALGPVKRGADILPTLAAEREVGERNQRLFADFERPVPRLLVHGEGIRASAVKHQLPTVLMAELFERSDG